MPIISLLLTISLCFLFSSMVFILREQARGKVSRVKSDSAGRGRVRVNGGR
jgi:hypothetical protein